MIGKRSDERDDEYELRMAIDKLEIALRWLKQSKRAKGSLRRLTEEQDAMVGAYNATYMKRKKEKGE